MTTTTQRTPLRFRFEGVTYRFHPGELTGDLERGLWAAARLTVPDVVAAASHGAGFAVAALLWLARTQAGHKIPYKAVEDDFYRALRDGGDLDLELILDEEDDAGPPAGAGN